MKTYIAHYKPLLERKTALLEQLSITELDVSWIENEPTNYTTKRYSPLESLWKERTAPFVEQYGKVPFRELNRADISLIYKHFLIFSEVTFSSDSCDYALVLEDDVILSDDFEERLSKITKKKDWDIVFLGNGCNLRINPRNLIPGEELYYKNHPASKCTDSYLIRKSAALKLYTSWKEFVLPIDFEMNYWMWKHNLNVYWLEPPIVQQGSQNGTYKSTLNDK